MTLRSSYVYLVSLPKCLDGTSSLDTFLSYHAPNSHDSFLPERGRKDVEKVLTLAESPPYLNLFLVSLLIVCLIMESVAYFYG